MMRNAQSFLGGDALPLWRYDWRSTEHPYSGDWTYVASDWCSGTSGDRVGLKEHPSPGGSSPGFIGWNEPNVPGQCESNPDGLDEESVKEYVALAREFKQRGKFVVTPAPGGGSPWLDNFLSVCERLGFKDLDFMAFHHYVACDSGTKGGKPFTTPEMMYASLEKELDEHVKVMMKYNDRGFRLKGIWLSETACAPDGGWGVSGDWRPGAAEILMDQLLKLVDANPLLKAFGWFPYRQFGMLWNETTYELTDLGKTYFSHCHQDRYSEASGPLIENSAKNSLSAQAETPVELWQSAKDTGDKLTKKDSLSFGDDFIFSGPVVDVRSETAQTMVGFGGAFTHAAADVFQNLTKKQQQDVLEMYFGKDGLGFTVGRVPINSCDFTPGKSFSFDDVAGDFSLQHFDESLTGDKDALLPLILAAQEMLKETGKELKLLATPWSPPGWMKTNGDMLHSGSPCLKGEWERETWASYVSRWISAYKNHGIPIWATSVQNEPENNATWEACLMTPDEQLTQITQHLGPKLRDEHPEVKIFAFDHNKDHVELWADRILSDSVAADFVSGVAFHWYSGDNFTAIQNIQRKYPKHALLASEATYERWQWKNGTTLAEGDWHFGEGYGHDILGDLNAGSVGWIDWNLILDENGGPNKVNNTCDAALMTNFSTGEIYKHPQFYYLGHFSKFILPGSERLWTDVLGSKSYSGKSRDYGTCTGDDGLQATAAVRPDGMIAVVVLNCGDDAIDFKLRNGQRALKATVPAHGIQTYLFEEPTSTAEVFV